MLCGGSIFAITAAFRSRPFLFPAHLRSSFSFKARRQPP
jgi:hypothetical protein